MAACHPEPHRQHGGRERDRGLAAAHVALQQPVHGLGPAHVPGDLAQHPPLGPGEREGQRRHRARQRRRRGVEGDPRLGAHPAPPARQHQLQEEQLLEDESPEGRAGPRPGQHRIGPGRREVHLLERLAPPQQAALDADLGRELVQRQRRQLVAEPLHELAQGRVLVVGGADVERHDAPEVGRVARLDLLHLGLAHLPAPAVALGHLPRGEERVADREPIEAPGRRVEEDQLQRGRRGPGLGIGHRHLEDGPAVAHALRARGGHADEHVRLVAQGQLADPPHAGPVLVGLGPELQGRLDRLPPALLELGPRRRVRTREIGQPAPERAAPLLALGGGARLGRAPGRGPPRARAPPAGTVRRRARGSARREQRSAMAGQEPPAAPAPGGPSGRPPGAREGAG